METALIYAGLEAATELVSLYARAAKAANDGDEEAAKEFLAQARNHYAASRASWDAAPGPE